MVFIIYVLKSLFVLLLHTPINGLPLSVIFKQHNAKMEIFASVAVFAFHDLCHIQHHTRQQCLPHVTVTAVSASQSVSKVERVEL